MLTNSKTQINFLMKEMWGSNIRLSQIVLYLIIITQKNSLSWKLSFLIKKWFVNSVWKASFFSNFTLALVNSRKTNFYLGHFSVCIFIDTFPGHHTQESRIVQGSVVWSFCIFHHLFDLVFTDTLTKSCHCVLEFVDRNCTVSIFIEQGERITDVV